MSESEMRPCLAAAARDDGLTIVELLIALTIVMITFAALASTVIASFSAIRNNEDRVVATALANEAIEGMTTMPWAQLGLSESDPNLPFDLTSDPPDEPVFEGEGEQVVILQEEIADGVPPHFDDSETAARDGRQYEITRWVTFIDEDEGSDLKRMIVIVTWDDGERSIRTEGVRAPDPSDLIDLQILSMDIASQHPESGGPYIRLRDPADTNAFGNRDAFDVTVVVGDVSASLTLSFRDRDGTLRVITAPTTGEGTDTRIFTIAQHAYDFPHGPVPFLATATGADGQIASDVETARFYQPLNVHEDVPTDVPADVQDTVQELVVTQQTDGLPANTIFLDPVDCQPTDVVRIAATVWGMTANEAGAEGALVATWTGPSEVTDPPTAPDPPRPLGQIEATLEGGLYGADVYNDDPDVALEPTFQQGTYTFRVNAERVVDGFPTLGDYTSEDTAAVTVTVQADEGTCQP